MGRLKLISLYFNESTVEFKHMFSYLTVEYHKSVDTNNPVFKVSNLFYSQTEIDTIYVDNTGSIESVMLFDMISKHKHYIHGVINIECRKAFISLATPDDIMRLVYKTSELFKFIGYNQCKNNINNMLEKL